MVTLSNNGRVNVSRLTSFTIGSNTRSCKRLKLKLELFLRRPFNATTYKKAVQTVDVSANGLLVLCDINVELGAELVVSNVKGDVVVLAVVKHTSKDIKTGKYLLGLSIIKKNTSWFVQEPTDQLEKSSLTLSLATEAIC